MSEDVKERARKRLKEKQDKGRFKLVEGENTIRLLPTPEGTKTDGGFFEYLVHRDVGPNKRFVRCGKKMNGSGSCWICDVQVPKLQAGTEVQRTRAANLKPQEQFVVQVAVLDSNTEELSGPKLWAVPSGGARSVAGRILGLLTSPRKDYTDAKKGYCFTIERTGTGPRDTKYGPIEIDEEATPVPKEIMAKLKPFEEILPKYSEEQQKAAYFGREAEESEEEEETPVAKKRRSDEDEEEETPKKKKKPVDDEEEEEEEESDSEDSSDDEDEEEDEKPAKKKKKPVDEDEEEEEEDEEESSDEDEEEEESDDDDDPPAKKKKKPVDEDEEEEEEDVDADEDEEEEEAPKKKKKKPADDDEEEEEEESSDDDDEEEEEIVPKKKKKPADDDEEEEEDEAPKKKKKRR